MKVRDVMTTEVVTVGPRSTFKQTVEKMVAARVSGLPVVVEDDQLVGIVTEADLMSKEAFGEGLRPMAALLSFATGDRQWVGKATGLTARDVMSVNVVTVGPDEDIRAAARRMLREGVKRLPVVQDGKLIGIVSRHDLLEIFHRADADIAAEIDARLASPLYAPEDHHVTATVVDGVVTLKGFVAFELERPAMVGLAAQVPGVVAVVDELTWARRGPALR